MANNNLTATKSELINKLITAKQLMDAGKLTDGSFIPTIEKASSNDMDVYNAMTPYLEGNANSPVDSRVMDIYRTVPQYGSDRFKTITDRFNQIGSRLIENPNDQSVNNEFTKAKLASLSPTVMAQYAQQYNLYNKSKNIPLSIQMEELPNGTKVWTMKNTIPQTYQMQPSYYMQNPKVMEQNSMNADAVANIVANRLKSGAKENWQSMTPTQAGFIAKTIGLKGTSPNDIQQWINENPNRANLIRVQDGKILVNNVINPTATNNPND